MITHGSVIRLLYTVFFYFRRTVYATQSPFNHNIFLFMNFPVNTYIHTYIYMYIENLKRILMYKYKKQGIYVGGWVVLCTHKFN